MTENFVDCSGIFDLMAFVVNKVSSLRELAYVLPDRAVRKTC